MLLIIDKCCSKRIQRRQYHDALQATDQELLDPVAMPKKLDACIVQLLEVYAGAHGLELSLAADNWASKRDIFVGNIENVEYCGLPDEL